MTRSTTDESRQIGRLAMRHYLDCAFNDDRSVTLVLPSGEVTVSTLAEAERAIQKGAKSS